VWICQPDPNSGLW